MVAVAANVDDQDLLVKLAQDADTDVRMWVACNPMKPEMVLGRLRRMRLFLCAEELRKTRARRCPLLARLCDYADVVVRALASRNRISRSARRDSLRERGFSGSATRQDSGSRGRR